MERQQLQKETELYNKGGRLEVIRSYIVMYLDIIIRSLISFFIVGILCSFVFYGFLHLNLVLVLIFSFFISVLVSPLFSKIRVADKLLSKYENFLENLFKKQK